MQSPDKVIQTKEQLKSYLHQLEKTQTKSVIGYFSITKFGTPDGFSVNCLIVVTLYEFGKNQQAQAVVGDFVDMTERQEVSINALEAFQEDVAEFCELTKGNQTIYRIEAIAS